MEQVSLVHTAPFSATVVAVLVAENGDFIGAKTATVVAENSRRFPRL